MSDKKIEVKTTIKKEVLTFDNDLVGKISVDRNKLISSIENEHRSYGAHSCTIEGENDFILPELKVAIPEGFKLDLVVKIKDNLGKKGKRGSKKSI